MASPMAKAARGLRQSLHHHGQRAVVGRPVAELAEVAPAPTPLRVVAEQDTRMSRSHHNPRGVRQALYLDWFCLDANLSELYGWLSLESPVTLRQVER
jgi:hypothetical protein